MSLRSVHFSRSKRRDPVLGRLILLAADEQEKALESAAAAFASAQSAAAEQEERLMRLRAALAALGLSGADRPDLGAGG